MRIDMLSSLHFGNTTFQRKSQAQHPVTPHRVQFTGSNKDGADNQIAPAQDQVSISRPDASVPTLDEFQKILTDIGLSNGEATPDNSLFLAASLPPDEKQQKINLAHINGAKQAQEKDIVTRFTCNVFDAYESAKAELDKHKASHYLGKKDSANSVSYAINLRSPYHKIVLMTELHLVPHPKDPIKYLHVSKMTYFNSQY
jgi:hypothetical protein